MRRALALVLLAAATAVAATPSPRRPVLNRAGDAVGDTPAVPAGGPGLTLKEAFRKASLANELLPIQEENVEQAKARYRQTRGGVLPNVSLIGTETLQDTSGTSSGGSEVQKTLTSSHREEARINLTQPIFQGFKEFAALRGLKSDEKRQELLLRRQGTLLFQDVAQAFFDVVKYETQLADLRALMKLSTDRTKELRERVDLGKSRGSEVTTAESQLASYLAQEAGLKGQIAVARETLSFIVSEDVTASPIVDDIPLPRAAPPLSEVVQRVADRSDIAAFREEVEGRRAGVRVAKGTYFPTLGVSANYYLKRTGSQSAIDWDAVFTLDAPLYRGGAVRALQREAESLERQAEKNLTLQQRLATSDVRKAHALLTTSIEQAGLLEDAVRKARKTYDSLTREYRLGLVNNLDVLQAMNALESVRQEYDVALLQSKLNLLNLRLAVEMAPENLP